MSLHCMIPDEPRIDFFSNLLGGREACVDVCSECSWAPKVALQDVRRVKSRGPVYRLLNW